MSNDIAPELYLELLKKCLTGSVYPGLEGTMWPTRFLLRKLLRALLPSGVRFFRLMTADERERGLVWPLQGQTMIGQKRLNNLQFCVEDVLKRGVPGDLIETGVWRGGAVIFMRAILKAHGVKDRTVWAADSFAGFPKPNAEKYAADAGDLLHMIPEFAVSLEQVKASFAGYGLLDDQVRFLEGWFKDTLPAAPITKLAVLRLDGDLYESTMDALSNLYPKLSVGGYVIVDDYAVDFCKKAVQDYRTQHGIQDEIKDIDNLGVFWQRTA